MELPFRNLFRKFNKCIGELCEDFFALAMAHHRIDYNYVKSTRGKRHRIISLLLMIKFEIAF